ncbi:hypothetical protein FSP39_018404 [Pinctada imbricata]|uniref:Uncharacterized protein n=1 Tax=Pinctada imbricata TaxID=66713 RepID=A0AA88XZR7_PINIB|nr:hypothetical protein FSP39_018404 [Pinctada imbricata]
MPLFRSNSQEERSKQFDTHFHPEKNVVQGIDVTKLPRQHSMQKPGIHMPKLLAMTGGCQRWDRQAATTTDALRERRLRK